MIRINPPPCLSLCGPRAGLGPQRRRPGGPWGRRGPRPAAPGAAGPPRRAAPGAAGALGLRPQGPPRRRACGPWGRTRQNTGVKPLPARSRVMAHVWRRALASRAVSRPYYFITISAERPQASTREGLGIGEAKWSREHPGESKTRAPSHGYCDAERWVKAGVRPREVVCGAGCSGRRPGVT